MTVALYARVSTTDQNCEMQLEELRRYAAARGWPIHKEYVDAGWSGRKTSRPALDELMKDALARKVGCILVYKLDRWGRSVIHMGSSIAQLRTAGIRFIATSQGIDTDMNSPTANLQLHILAAVAEFERELIKERVTLGIRRYAGEFKAGRAESRSGKNLAPHRPKKVFDRALARDMRATGASWNDIAIAVGESRSTVRRALTAGVK